MTKQATTTTDKGKAESLTKEKAAELFTNHLDLYTKAGLAGDVMEKARILPKLRELAEKAEVDLAEFLRQTAPKAMAEAHAEAKKAPSAGGFGKPVKGSRRGFIVSTVAEGIWDMNTLAEAIHLQVEGYAVGTVRNYRGREVTVTEKKNKAAITGTLNDLADDGYTIRTCADGRLAVTKKA